MTNSPTPPTTTGHIPYERVVDLMPSVSLADIGFAEDAEYRALALCKIVTNYYPTGRRERLKHGTVVTVDALTDPAAIRDVCAVVEMIKDHQMQF